MLFWPWYIGHSNQDPTVIQQKGDPTHVEERKRISPWTAPGPCLGLVPSQLCVQDHSNVHMKVYHPGLHALLQDAPSGAGNGMHKGLLARLQTAWRH